MYVYYKIQGGAPALTWRVGTRKYYNVKCASTVPPYPVKKTGAPPGIL